MENSNIPRAGCENCDHSWEAHREGVCFGGLPKGVYSRMDVTCHCTEMAPRVPPASALAATPEPGQCTSMTGGGRYRCKFPAGHSGWHQASGVFNTWTDPEAPIYYEIDTPQEPVCVRCHGVFTNDGERLVWLCDSCAGVSRPAAPTGEKAEPIALREAWKSIRQGVEGNGARLSARECSVLTAQATELAALRTEYDAEMRAAKNAHERTYRAWEAERAEKDAELTALRARVEETARVLDLPVSHHWTVEYCVAFQHMQAAHLRAALAPRQPTQEDTE